MARLMSIRKAIGRKPGKRGIRLGHNTYMLPRANGGFDVILCRTIVASYKPDYNVLTLTTGGWNTRITAERISHVLAHFGLHLLTHDLPNVWRVADNKGNAWSFRDGFVHIKHDNNSDIKNWARLTLS